MQKVVLFVQEKGRAILRSRLVVGGAALVVTAAGASAQTADPNVVSFTADVSDKATAIAAGLPAAGLAGLTLFAVWYGIAMVMKTFKTVA